MPYLGASFDDATQAALAEAADRFAANSPFERDQTRPFHIPLIGGLHVYTRDEIINAVEAGSQAASDAIEGRFVRWEASPRGRLRVVVSLKSHDGLERIRWLLPRGKEWPHGAAANATRRANFLVRALVDGATPSARVSWLLGTRVSGGRSAPSCC